MENLNHNFRIFFYLQLITDWITPSHREHLLLCNGMYYAEYDFQMTKLQISVAWPKNSRSFQSRCWNGERTMI